MIDYSKYSLDELLEVQRTIEPQSENYAAFSEELAKRQSEINERHANEEQKQYDLDIIKIKTVGVFQLISGVVLVAILLYSAFFGSGVSFFSAVIAIPLALLNGFAGLTALKLMSKWYWVSIFNQALQLVSASIGTLYVNYAGLGYFNIWVSWGNKLSLGFDAQLSPGFAFYKYTENLQNQFIGIDLLAILFIFALIRIKDGEESA